MRPTGKPLRDESNVALQGVEDMWTGNPVCSGYGA